MKKQLLFAATIIACTSLSFAQNNVGIGTPTPDASAILELQDNSKGLLIPRLTTTQRQAIAAPANGLLVYDVTVNCFFYFSTGWNSLCQVSGLTNHRSSRLTRPHRCRWRRGRARTAGSSRDTGRCRSYRWIQDLKVYKEFRDCKALPELRELQAPPEIPVRKGCKSRHTRCCRIKVSLTLPATRAPREFKGCKAYRVSQVLQGRRALQDPAVLLGLQDPIGPSPILLTMQMV